MKEKKKKKSEREREREVTVEREVSYGGESDRRKRIRVFAPLYRVMRILVSFSVTESKLVCGAVTMRFMRALIIFKIVFNEIM